jgi:hypothetical protein
MEPTNEQYIEHGVPTEAAEQFIAQYEAAKHT